MGMEVNSRHLKRSDSAGSDVQRSEHGKTLAAFEEIELSLFLVFVFRL